MKGIIFDKDGTLLKFESFWRPVTEHAIEYTLRERKAPPGMKDRMMEAAGLDSGICGLIYRGTYAQLSEAFQNVLEEGGMEADRRILKRYTETVIDNIGNLPEIRERESREKGKST